VLAGSVVVDVEHLAERGLVAASQVPDDREIAGAGGAEDAASPAW
jgi:hypothetical protein